MITKLTVLTLCFFLTGCASIVDGGDKNVRFTSNPTGAKVTIRDNTGALYSEQTTPFVVPLKRSDGFFVAANYWISCELPGYQSEEIQLKARMNPWYLGNIVFGGLIGILIVDPATGAMWTYPIDDLNFSLMRNASTLEQELKDSLLQSKNK